MEYSWIAVDSSKNIYADGNGSALDALNADLISFSVSNRDVEVTVRPKKRRIEVKTAHGTIVYEDFKNGETVSVVYFKRNRVTFDLGSQVELDRYTEYHLGLKSAEKTVKIVSNNRNSEYVLRNEYNEQSN